MNKTEFQEWATKTIAYLDVPVASSTFSADGIWNGLGLDGVDEEDQKILAANYRVLRLYMKSKEAFEKAKENLASVSKERRAEILKELGYGK